MLITRVFYALMPLWVLLVATFIACFVGYFIVLGISDQIPLRKIISKTTLVFLVLSIIPAMRYLKLSREQLGFAPKADFLRQVLQGFGIGFVTLLPVFIVLYALGVTVWDDSQVWTLATVAEKSSIALLLALLISLLEEPLFRGILLAGFKKQFSLAVAVLLSAFYYAALHFLTSKTDIPLQDMTLFSGFTLLGDAFANLFNPAVFSAFFALLMVGIFLGVMRTQIKASLGVCIGCHSCWVWQIKMSKMAFNTDIAADYVFLVSRYDGVIGSLVSGWLLLVLVAYFVYLRLKTHKHRPMR